MDAESFFRRVPRFAHTPNLPDQIQRVVEVVYLERNEAFTSMVVSNWVEYDRENDVAYFFLAPQMPPAEARRLRRYLSFQAFLQSLYEVFTELRGGNPRNMRDLRLGPLQIKLTVSF